MATITLPIPLTSHQQNQICLALTQYLTDDRSNRYSMPVTSSMQNKRESVADMSAAGGMGMSHISTTSFLFDDDEKHTGQKESATSPDVKNYLQMNVTDDKFPILVRNTHKPGTVRTFLILSDYLRLTWASALCLLGCPRLGALEFLGRRRPDERLAVVSQPQPALAAELPGPQRARSRLAHGLPAA